MATRPGRLRVITQLNQMTRAALALRRQGKSIGFVPTMGALHDGHAALLRAAAKGSDVAVMSLFVNPLQFGPREDFAHYPRDRQHDFAIATTAGCRIVFAPEVESIYPKGFGTTIEVSGVSDRLEGRVRPGHFRGVATVVAKLFHIVQPATAWFGQKDYQQTLVIRRMVADLAIPVAIRVLPTVRERDGLAMSSRNVYLEPDQRRQATALYRALQEGRARVRSGERDVKRLLAAMRARLAEAPLVRPDYLVVADAATLEPLSSVRGRVAILIAARVGTMRLIDNILVDVS